MNFGSIPDGASFILSVLAFAVSLLSALYESLVPACLRWQKPLVFSLDDERTDPKHEHRPAIAIALTVHNAGARPGIVWDTAVLATRLGYPGGSAVFQARVSASEPRYVSTFEVEENARPTTAIVLDGHQTKTIVVQFEQRSNGHWRWQPGSYTAKVYSLGRNGQWTERTSFEFALSDESMHEEGQVVRVKPCQRWTSEVLRNRDALINRSSRRGMGASWSFRRR